MPTPTPTIDKPTARAIVFTIAWFVSSVAAYAETPIYRCIDAGRVSYGAQPCDGGRTVERPALQVNESDRLAAERRVAADVARADRFMDRVHRDQALDDKRRHDAALAERRLELARLHHEEAQARRAERQREHLTHRRATTRDVSSRGQ